MLLLGVESAAAVAATAPRLNAVKLRSMSGKREDRGLARLLTRLPEREVR